MSVSLGDARFGSEPVKITLSKPPNSFSFVFAGKTIVRFSVDDDGRMTVKIADDLALDEAGRQFIDLLATHAQQYLDDRK